MHGAELGFAFLLPPGSVLVELDPGVADSDQVRLDMFRRQIVKSGVRFLHFKGTHPSSALCMDWWSGMMLSPHCGIVVSERLFSEMAITSFREYFLGGLAG